MDGKRRGEDGNARMGLEQKGAGKMQYQGTSSCARQFAACGQLETWVHAYLCSDGRNTPFSDGLRRTQRYYLGPVQMPLTLFQRCCGPEIGMKWPVEASGFEKRVLALEAAICAGVDIPPLIVGFFQGIFELNDGNHRWEAYRRLGIQTGQVIIWITGQADLTLFLSQYGKLFAAVCKEWNKK